MSVYHLPLNKSHLTYINLKLHGKLPKLCSLPIRIESTRSPLHKTIMNKTNESRSTPNMPSITVRCHQTASRITRLASGPGTGWTIPSPSRKWPSCCCKAPTRTVPWASARATTTDPSFSRTLGIAPGFSPLRTSSCVSGMHGSCSDAVSTDIQQGVTFRLVRNKPSCVRCRKSFGDRGERVSFPSSCKQSNSDTKQWCRMSAANAPYLPTAWLST